MPFDLEARGDGRVAVAGDSLATYQGVSLEIEQQPSATAVAVSPSMRTRVIRLLPRSARRRVYRVRRKQKRQRA